MNQAEYFQYHEDFCRRALDLSRNKNHDYSGQQAEDNPFANLELVEKMNIVSTPIGILTRITDKIARINSFIQQGVFKVVDEKIEDTCMDLVNYTILLSAWIKSKRTPQQTVSTWLTEKSGWRKSSDEHIDI